MERKFNRLQIESKAQSSYKGTAPSRWFRYVDDRWVKITAGEVEAFMEHIKLTREDPTDHKTPVLFRAH